MTFNPPEKVRLLGGIVLAGGSGRRMGRPKASVVFRGQTLVDRALDALAPWCTKVAVVIRPEVAIDPTPRLSGSTGELSVEIGRDRPGWDGPLAGLAAGLAMLDCDEVLVLACDLPLAAPAIAELAATVRSTLPPAPPVLVASDANGRLHGLCARYLRQPTSTAAERLLASGERRLGALLDALEVQTISFSGEELFNVNTPDDLERLNR